MEQEQKELLLKDLCARLPYGVKVNITSKESKNRIVHLTEDNICNLTSGWWSECKPYLFPMSSMTEKQKREYNFWKHEVLVCYYKYGNIVEKVELLDSPESFEYLIENHFDYRGLIEKGLALDATGLNIYD